MSVAVLLSGRIVTGDYDETVRRLKCTFDGYDVTYFVSVNASVHNTEYTKRFAEELGRVYVNIEETNCPFDYTIYTKKKETCYEHVYSMFYHNKRCFEMAVEYMEQYKTRFDVIVKYRSDIRNEYELRIIQAGDNTIYIPEGYDYNGLNDNIAYGNIESMCKYTKCVDYISYLCECGTVYHPETILDTYLKLVQVDIERIQFPYEIGY